MTTILEKDGADVKTIICEERQCERDGNDKKCGYIYINKKSKIFKYCCLYCSNAYDDILNFCQHIMVHLYDTEELFNDGVDEFDVVNDSQISIKEEVVDDNGYVYEEYSMDNLDDALVDDDTEDLFNEIDEWEQIAAEAEDEMRMNSEVFEECGYYNYKNRNMSTDYYDNKDHHEPKKSQMKFETVPIIVPKKVLYEKNYSYKQTNNIKNMKMLSNNNKVEDEKIIVDSIPKTFKQKIIGETVITLIPEGVQPPKRSTKSLPKTAVIEIHSTLPPLPSSRSSSSGVEEIPTSLPIIALDSQEISENPTSPSCSIEETMMCTEDDNSSQNDNTQFIYTKEDEENSTIVFSSPAQSSENVQALADAHEMSSVLPFVASLKRSINDLEETVCPACGKEFRNVMSLAVHKRSHYLETKNNIKLAVQCPECEALFNNIQKLSQHIKNEHFPNGFICKICNTTLTSLHLLEAHMRRIHLFNPYKCRFCGKQFPDASSYEEHATILNGCGYNYQCKICSRNFIKKKSLQIHMGTHNKERVPRKCTVCGKNTFRLKYHMKIHSPRTTTTTTALRKCPLCAKSFKFNSGLAAHIRMVHKKKPAKKTKTSNLKRKLISANHNEMENKNIQIVIESANETDLITLPFINPDDNTNHIEPDNEETEKILTEILDCDAFLDDNGDYLECSVEDFKPLI